MFLITANTPYIHTYIKTVTKIIFLEKFKNKISNILLFFTKNNVILFFNKNLTQRKHFDLSKVPSEYLIRIELKYLQFISNVLFFTCHIFLKIKTLIKVIKKVVKTEFLNTTF